MFIKVPLKTKSPVSLKIFRTAAALVGIIRAHHVDVMHANTRVGQLAAFWAWLFTKVPYVSTYHGFYKAHFFRRFFTMAGARAVAISSAVRRHMIEDLRISPKKISVVHNGIVLDDYRVKTERTEIREKYSVVGTPVVSIVARLSREKNHCFLLDAFALVLKRFPTARLLICGNGREADNIWHHAKAIDITHAVTMIPQAPAKEIFSISDAVVLPSTEEGFGFSLIEAQAVRACPVIGSAIGGITDVIEHGKTGLIFNRFEPTLLAHEIEKVLSSAIFSYDLTDNAYRAVTEKFTVDTMAAGTMDVYRSVI
jgi:glycosyltransferase involved in cell wall biosynthesis